MNLTIRLEQQSDYRIVEAVTREAFWNLYVPGCDEHYLAHKIRDISDFIPELDFVALVGDQIVGNIMYTKSHIEDGSGKHINTVTFGPVSVLPSFQRKGIGSALIRHSMDIASEMGFAAVEIYGDPKYYERFGFVSAKQFGISAPDGRYPTAHQILELRKNALRGVSDVAFESPDFCCEPEAAAQFDATFPHKEKCVTDSQADFQRINQTFL